MHIMSDLSLDLEIFSPSLQTQSTLLQMTGKKAANKKSQENTEPAAGQQKRPDVPPPTSPADNTENKRWEMETFNPLKWPYWKLQCRFDLVVMLTLFRPKTGFQLWLEDNRKSILADLPDLEETDIIKEAMGRFRTLSAEERLVRNAEGFREEGVGGASRLHPGKLVII